MTRPVALEPDQPRQDGAHRGRGGLHARPSQKHLPSPEWWDVDPIVTPGLLAGSRGAQAAVEVLSWPWPPTEGHMLLVEAALASRTGWVRCPDDLIARRCRGAAKSGVIRLWPPMPGWTRFWTAMGDPRTKDQDGPPGLMEKEVQVVRRSGHVMRALRAARAAARGDAPPPSPGAPTEGC